MSNPFAKTYEDLRKPYYEGKMAKKDYDGDGKIESGTDEYKGSVDKAIKKAMGKKVTKEHHQKDADGNVIPHEEVEVDEATLATARKNIGRDPKKKSCWKGYTATTTKMKGGKAVPDCKKEEVEQIDELSKKTLGGYVKKASKEARGNMVATQHGSGIPKKAKDIKLKQVNKRMKGIEKAGEKLAKEEVVDEMITLTKGDFASRNVAGSAYSVAKGKGFDKKIYKAGGGLGSNFLPLANSHEPEGKPIEEKDTSAMKKYLDAKAKRLTKEKEAQKPEYRNNPAFGDPSHHSNRKNRKEAFSDWRSDFIWEDGDSVKKT